MPRNKRRRDGLYEHPKTGIWWVRFWLQGREFRRSTRTRNSQAAYVEARRIRVEVEQAGPVVSAERVLLSKLAAADIASAKARGVTSGHARILETKWLVILRNLPTDLAVQDLNYDTVQNYILKRRGAGIRGQTITREVQALKRLLKIAKRRGMIRELPDEWPTVRSDPQDSQHTGKLWSPDAVAAVLAQLDQDARDEVLFAALTGLRAAELKRVEPSWIRMTPGGMSPAILEIPSLGAKTRTSRTVGIAQTALEIVQRRIAVDPSSPVVFSQANHKKARRLASKRAGLPTTMTLRDLRHSFASWAVVASGDLVAVQRVLGHRDLRMTERYLSATVDRIQNTSRAVEIAFQPDHHDRITESCFGTVPKSIVESALIQRGKMVGAAGLELAAPSSQS